MFGAPRAYQPLVMSPFRPLVTALVVLAAAVPAARADDPSQGRIGPDRHVTGNGRVLTPAGRLTTVGNFPTGGALTPDGKFLWVVDSGHAANDVKVVKIATGAVVQTLPLPGAYGAVAFAPDGRHAYVSGESKGSSTPAGPTKGDAGDVVHVFTVDPASGRATEAEPIAMPSSTGGSGQRNSFPPVSAVWPAGLSVSPDGRTLAVALNQADRVALVDLPAGAVRTVQVGAYPFATAFAPDGRTAYVTNEQDGTISVVDVATGSQAATIDAGGAGAHPEGMAVDAARKRLFVAVANRDRLLAVDLPTRKVLWSANLGRPEAPGTQPVAVAISPDGATAVTANEGEDALALVSTRTAKVVGRIPTAAFPMGVAITPDGGQLAWIAAKGFGAGPNPGYVFDVAKPTTTAPTTSDYVMDKLTGTAGVLGWPSQAQLSTLTAQAAKQTVPANRPSSPPAGTPLRPGGPIKHVFYIVRENRTYDQVFGSEPRGDGDPRLQLFDDNGVPGPTGGVTPNAHALARRFGLLDHVYADSEVSVDGHLITAGSIAIDYAQRGAAANYSGRGRTYDFGVYPVTFGPRAFVFDQAARQAVSFYNYGELGAGNTPGGNDGRPTYPAVVAHSNFAYPTNIQIGCLGPATPATCFRDSGVTGAAPTPAVGAASRFDTFAEALRGQLATDTVPTFNYLVLPNDHTNGTTAGVPTPKADIADNDLGLGQIVDLISHSKIWASSAIVVVEDDSQDGADHVDAHRMPAFVISPWTKTGAVVHTRYDQYSALRTAELLAGLDPLSINDALATPMYDVFRTDGKPDLRPYSAILPTQPLTELNPSGTPGAALAAKLPLDQIDQVPQAMLDEILWHSVHGARSTPPAPGPNASPAEHARAVAARRLLRRGGDVRAYLARTAGDASGD
jgi:YVTN family beta-propeller protein